MRVTGFSNLRRRLAYVLYEQLSASGRGGLHGVCLMRAWNMWFAHSRALRGSTYYLAPFSFEYAFDPNRELRLINERWQH